MKRRELLAHLNRHGCVLLREGGQHSIFHNPANDKTAPVPRHRMIGRGLGIRICRELEIPDP